MDHAPIRIRNYEPADLDGLIELFRASVRHIVQRDYTREQIMAWAPDDVDRDAVAKRSLSRPTWVAEVGGVLAGYADLEPTGHLDHMYVHSNFQRRRVASALLVKVEAVARELGLTRIFSEVSITARAFFEHKGFSVIEAQTVTFRGQEFLNYRMEKIISVEQSR